MSAQVGPQRPVECHPGQHLPPFPPSANGLSVVKSSEISFDFLSSPSVMKNLSKEDRVASPKGGFAVREALDISFRKAAAYW